MIDTNQTASFCCFRFRPGEAPARVIYHNHALPHIFVGLPGTAAR
jgi:hypothetical protein